MVNKMEYKISKDNFGKRIMGKKKVVFEGENIALHYQKRNNLLKISEITIIDDTMKENNLIRQYNSRYKKLFKLIMDILETSSSSTDEALGLDEIFRVKKVLKDKYRHKVSNEIYRKMWKKVSLLEDELRNKIKLERILFEELMSSKGKSR